MNCEFDPMYDECFDPERITSINYESYPIIVCSKTGFFFSVQADHYACRHPSAEGFVIPFNLEKNLLCIPEELCGYSEGFSDDTRMKIAIAINKGLESYNDHFIYKIAFDFDRIGELMEGWIPVTLLTNDYKDNHKHYLGYLCSDNCD